MVNITLSFSEPEYLHLAAVAQSLDVPVAAWLKDAVEQFLPEWEEQYTEQEIQALHGQVVSVNRSEQDRYQCEIKLASGVSIQPIYFESDLLESLLSHLHQQIVAIGITTLNRHTRRLIRFEIKQVLPPSEAMSQDRLEQALADFKAENDTFTHFRQSWQEAQRGETYPLSQLWEDIDAD